MVLRLPQKVGQEHHQRGSNSEPEPLTAEIFAGTSEKYPGNDSQREDTHGVFRHRAQSDRASDSKPPPRVVGTEQANNEISGQDPEEVVERNVLHKRAAGQAKWDGSSSGDELSAALSSKFADHQTGEHNSNSLCPCREQAESSQRM